MNKLNPYVKADNCTDIADCMHGIEICSNIIKILQLQGKSALAYQRRLAKLNDKLQKFIKKDEANRMKGI
jgi:hypothetical protein